MYFQTSKLHKISKNSSFRSDVSNSDRLYILYSLKYSYYTFPYLKSCLKSIHDKSLKLFQICDFMPMTIMLHFKLNHRLQKPILIHQCSHLILSEFIKTVSTMNFNISFYPPKKSLRFKPHQMVSEACPFQCRCLVVSLK